MFERSMLVAAALLLGTSGALAQGQGGRDRSGQREPAPKALMIGDRAPELTIDQWVKGEPITGFEKGKVYVVEFWATWCGPCVASIPHLTDLQTNYRTRGVTVIGVTSPDPNNPLSAVEQMVKDKGDEMSYTVAFDTSDRTTNNAWMKAARQRGIPSAFIVNQDGAVAFIGHPMKIDEPLKQIVEKKYDIKAAAEKHRKHVEKAEKEYAVQEKVGAFMSHLRAGETPEAYRLGYELVDGPAKDDWDSLNGIAWSLVDPAAQLDNPDLGLALKAAERANTVSKGDNPYVLDTLARVWFLRGNHSKALKFQKQAVEHATDNPALKAELEQRLAQYEAAKK